MIKVGYQARGYIYRHVTAATGGRLYSLPPNGADEVANIVREILYSTKQHLEIFLPLERRRTEL